MELEYLCVVGLFRLLHDIDDLSHEVSDVGYYLKSGEQVDGQRQHQRRTDGPAQATENPVDETQDCETTGIQQHHYILVEPKLFEELPQAAYFRRESDQLLAHFFGETVLLMFMLCHPGIILYSALTRTIS